MEASMKISNSVWFWFLQIIGWGIPITINGIGKIVMDSFSSKYYTYAEIFIIFLSGITCSTLLRNYLKKHISFDGFKTKEIFKILIAYFITSIAFAISFLFALPFYKLFNGEYLELTSLLIISNILNAFAFIFLWLIFYIAIKSSRRVRENKIERLQMESTIKEAQLNTLKGQINPHFMFNSLNNIRGLMLEDVDKSREMITRLSEMLRYSLSKNNIDFIALNEEIEVIENYIELSKIQLEDRLVFTSEIASNLLHIEVPPMLIQMLIENAVKHGISNQKNGGIVKLNIFEKNKNLVIEVINTGKLASTKGTTKIGLKNIEDRLVLLYGGKANFSLSESNNHVTATIQIPI
ncbi:histidine kinase [Flavobacteriaceae bacterium R38]|nr:histidine kinase [Flavobacteriaceae bacterium R38]